MCRRWPVALALLATGCRSLRATGCVRRAAIEASLVMVPRRIWCAAAAQAARVDGATHAAAR
eukprot:6204637-Prymnesium_polylepis.1